MCVSICDYSQSILISSLNMGSSTVVLSFLSAYYGLHLKRSPCHGQSVVSVIASMENREKQNGKEPGAIIQSSFHPVNLLLLPHPPSCSTPSTLANDTHRHTHADTQIDLDVDKIKRRKRKKSKGTSRKWHVITLSRDMMEQFEARARDEGRGLQQIINKYPISLHHLLLPTRILSLVLFCLN